MKNNKKEDIFHTSTYGKSQNPNRIGVTSSETFTKRLATDKNRNMVRGYGDSDIVGTSRTQGPKAKTFTPLKKPLTSPSPRSNPPKNPW